MSAVERVIWSDHPWSDAKATMRELPNGDVQITTIAHSAEGADAAARFRRELRKRVPVPDPYFDDTP